MGTDFQVKSFFEVLRFEKSLFTLKVKITNNGKEATVNRALDGSTNPG